MSMETIEIIRDKSELDGTGYMELSLGKYEGKHWEDSSLFFDEEVFGYIENVFKKHVPNYDHYAMNDADESSWQNIIRDLTALSNLLESAKEFNEIVDDVGFIFGGTKDYFENNFGRCRVELLKLVNELIIWSKDNIKKYGFIAILGI